MKPRPTRSPPLPPSTHGDVFATAARMRYQSHDSIQPLKAAADVPRFYVAGDPILSLHAPKIQGQRFPSQYPETMTWAFSIPQSYGIMLGSLFLLRMITNLATRPASRPASWVRSSITPFVLREVLYPRIAERVLLLRDLTRFEGLILLVYVVANICSMVVALRDRKDAQSRAGVLSSINMLPLMVGARLGAMEEWLGVSLRVEKLIHRWISTMAILLGAIHTLLCVTDRLGVTWGASVLYGVIALSSFVLVFCSTLTCVRRYYYEIFLRTHVGLAFAANLLLWRHLSLQRATARLYILGGLGMWGLFVVLSLLAGMYRSFRFRWGKSIKMPNLGGNDQGSVFLATLTVPRAWDVRPGEYVYLWMPFLTPTAIFQAHPFQIMWWNYEDNKVKLHFLMQKRSGLSGRLATASTSALVFGPCGNPRSFETFGTVLMFASGIGIVSPLAYVKSLLDGRKASRSRVRSITLLWSTEGAGEESWANTFINAAIQSDPHYALKFVLHFPEGSPLHLKEKQRLGQDIVYPLPDKFGGEDGETPEIVRDAGSHNAIMMQSGAVHVEEEIRSQLRGGEGRACGRLLVAVAANRKSREKVREAVRKILGEGGTEGESGFIRFEEFDYQPDTKDALFR